MLSRTAGRTGVSAVLAGAALLALAFDAGAGPGPKALPAQEAWRKATCEGKYAMLLRQIKAPADAEKYGGFRDLGRRAGDAPAAIKDLPAGHWVYVYPYWYVWRDRTADRQPAKRNWGTEQATGKPDTPGAGDIVTAWASATPDGQDEWLLVEYAEPVVPAAALVHETYNPGALARVTAFRLDGEEVEVWKGKDPTAVGSPRGVSEVKLKAGFKTTRLKLYLASTKVPGWNEIDAVGLRDVDGKTQWARAAEASSTFGAGVPPPVPAPALRPGLPGRPGS
jgi:hypothetical protein